MAAQAHLGQTVPGTQISYLLHLAQVMSEVAAALYVEPDDTAELSLLCAILHDVVEDTKVSREDVEAAFGTTVASGVAALSKDSSLPKVQAMDDSLARIRNQPHAVWKVKLADRITNLQPPPSHWGRAKCVRYRSEAEKILATLGEASPVLALRLSERIKDYENHYPPA